MKITYMLGHFPVLSETFIGHEIRVMQALGHEISIIALQNPNGEAQPLDRELVNRVYYFSYIKKWRARKLILKNLLRIYRVISYIKQQTTEPFLPMLIHALDVAEQIKKNKSKHIHAHFAWGAATYAIAAGKLLNIPVTFTCHGSDVYARPQDLVLKCNSAKAIIATAENLASYLKNLSETPCHIIHCGVDTELIRPATDLSKKHERWIYFGRLVDCKGLDDILAAWKIIPTEQRPVLDIVGAGILEEKLKDFARDNDLENHINFLGARSSLWLAENAPYYRAFISAFKEGSDGARDTGPVALKEAMAMGLPVICTDFMEIKQITGDQGALLCPPQNPQKLAESVMTLHKMPPEMLEKMGKFNRIRVTEKFTLINQAKQLTEVIQSI